MNSSRSSQPSRETRKVQLAGGSTYTVSLPKRWADEHGIEAGRQVHLRPNGDGSLVVRAAPPQEADTETVRAPVEGYSEDDLRETVHALYAVGLNRFVLTAPDGFSTAKRRVITRAATDLVGLEAVAETNARIVFQNLVTANNESVRRSVLQLEYVTIWMHRNAVMAVANADTAQAERVIERDDEADRLFGLVTRHFHRALTSMQEIEQLGVDRPTMFDYYTTARQLERVADHAEKMATIARRLDDPSAADSIDELVSLAHQSREIVVDAASVLLGGGSVEQAYAAHTARDELVEAIDSLDRALHDSSAPDTYLLALALDSVRRTAEYGSNIAEAMIQASVRADTDDHS